MNPMKRISMILTSAAGLLAACGDDPVDPGPGDPEPAYLIASQIETSDGASTLLALTSDMPAGELDLTTAFEIPGYAEIQVLGDDLIVSASESFTITRYGVEDGVLVEGERMNLSDRGLAWMGESAFLDDERAFLMNESQLEIIEWNPSTMTVTRSWDITGMQRPDWGHEFRGWYLRPSDGVIFFYWAYTNDRVEFVNDLVVGVFDTSDGSLEVRVDETCPASAGFGGFFDEQGDLYLIADNFGGFTRFGDFPDPKTACILRIKDGERDFDPAYRFVPSEATDGLEPWGFYYAGDGKAYTTGVDPARTDDYPSLYEFIFAPIHEGWLLDIGAQTAEHLPDLPPDGVGFDSYQVAGELLIPRSTGTVEIYDIETVDTTVYSVDPATAATAPMFSMPGYLAAALRL